MAQAVLEECGADYLAIYEYPSSGLRLYVGVGAGERVVAVDGGICVVLRREVARSDAEEGALADMFSSLLLASPKDILGDVAVMESYAVSYVKRLVAEENYRLRRLLGDYLYIHAYVARIGLLVARMARLARFYTWLRPLYHRTLIHEPKWLHEAARAAGLQDAWLSLSGLSLRKPSRSPRLSTARTAVELALEASSIDLLRALPTSALVEGVSSPLPPPLRDPLLYLRLDAGKLATRLLRFEKQLYMITGVEDVLRSRKKSIIRSTRIIEARGGFIPAVVKHYRDLSIAKWLLAALLSLPLPQPRLGPRKRLGAEYHYNRLLAGLGYHVPDPILVDPRRLKAAYRYVEGHTLAELLSRNSVHPAYRDYGRLLARLHRDGVALWDSNPTNVIVCGDGGLCLVDLEQAREAKSSSEKAWDIAVAIYYSILYALGGVAERTRLLAGGYLEEGGDPAVLLEASRYRYAAPFVAVTPPNVLERVRRVLARAALEGGAEIPSPSGPSSGTG